MTRARLVAGLSGLDRLIRYVDIMEVPDFASWLRPNEFIITCAYAIRDNPAAQVGLVRHLARCNAAALAVKPSRFLGSMPDAMIRAADEESLPLIELPADIPYIEITHPLLSAILYEELHDLKNLASAYGKLAEIIVRQDGLGSLAETLAELLGRNVYVLDDRGTLIAGCSKFPGTLSSQRDAQSWVNESNLCPPASGGWANKGLEFQTAWACQQVLVFPMRGLAGGPSQDQVKPGQLLGFLLVDLGQKGCLSPVETAAAGHAAAAMGLELSRTRATAETEQRVAAEFIKEILAGKLSSEEVALAKARELRVDLEQPCAVLAMTIVHGVNGLKLAHRGRGDEESRFVDCIKEVGRALGIRTLMTTYDPGMVVLCFPEAEASSVSTGLTRTRQAVCGPSLDLERRVMDFSLALLAQPELDGRSLLVGVSSVQVGISSIASGYAQAVQALKLGKRVNGVPSVTHFNQVSPYVLLRGLSRNQLESYWKNNLGRLDRDHTLINTLKVFLERGCDASDAAARLFVHRNTLAYRLKNIERRLGCDLKDPDVQFRLRMAIMAGILTGRISSDDSGR